jgi:hypothetical protein
VIDAIPAPRVDFIDPRTGKISREWYRFLLSLFRQVGTDTNFIIEDFSLEPEPELPFDFDLSTAALLQPDTPPEPSPAYYGAFTDAGNQTAAVINTAYPVEFDTIGAEFGVRIGPGDTEVTFDSGGLYRLEYTVQLDLSGGSPANAAIWLRRNGVTNVPNSANLVSVERGMIVARAHLLTVAAGEYVELMWSVGGTNVRLQATAASAPVPDVPSAALTVTQVL